VAAHQAAREILFATLTPSTVVGGADGEQCRDWPAAIAAATSTSSTRCSLSSSRSSAATRGARASPMLLTLASGSFCSVRGVGSISKLRKMRGLSEEKENPPQRLGQPCEVNLDIWAMTEKSQGHDKPAAQVNTVIA